MAKYRGKNHYMGAWRYVFLDILYAIPLIGFIMLLVHSFSSKNENRLHYARSYFARFLLVIILIAAIGAACYFLIGTERLTEICEEVTTKIHETTELVEPADDIVFVETITPPTTQSNTTTDPINGLFQLLNTAPTDAPAAN